MLWYCECNALLQSEMVENSRIALIIHTPLRGSVVSRLLGLIIGFWWIKRSSWNNKEEEVVMCCIISL